jgi:hypothetical protein
MLYNKRLVGRGIYETQRLSRRMFKGNRSET